MQDDSGELRKTYEAWDEKFIKKVKKEVTTMRHTDQFLVTVLGKLLCTDMLKLLNKDNPNSNQPHYQTTPDFKIYKYGKYPNPCKVVEDNDIMAGVIDSKGNLLLCFEDASGISLHSLNFHDTKGHWCLNLW